MDQEQDQAPGNAGSLRERLRGALPRAMKARDAVAVAALRSTLAAIDNAEAVDPARAPAPGAGQVEVAGAVVGLGAGEVERRSLTEAQMEEIVRTEVADRRAAAHDYQRRGRHEQAERLRGEAEVLSSYLSEPA
jgi:uncharacterized protein